MKKFFTLIALALAAVSANAQVATFSATGQWNETDDVTVSPEVGAAGRVGLVIVSFENTDEIVGYQFDIALPEGVTKVGDYTIDDYAERYVVYNKTVLNEETYEEELVPTNLYVSPKDMQVLKADGSYYIPVMQNPSKEIIDEAAKQLDNLKIAPGSGKAGQFRVRVPEDFEGPATINFKNVVATTLNEEGNTVSNDCADFSVQLVKVSTEISTAIDRVDAQTLTGKEIYNLSGQRVSKPSQRGIYIVDGKKIMVK